MRIQHNIAAMNSYRNYTNNTSAVAKNLEKLSSGYKINRAGDDAAGLAISEKMRAQVTGLKTAQKNAKDGISLVKTGEGALTEVHDMLNRMFELAEQSSNGTYDNEVDRANLQKEISSLKTEIDRIADSVNFNGINLLDGSLAGGGSTSSSVTGGYGKVVSTITAPNGNPAISSLTAAGGAVQTSDVTLDDTEAAKLVAGDVEYKVDFIKDGETHSVTFKATLGGAPADGAELAEELVKDEDAIQALKDLGIAVEDNTDGTLSFSTIDKGKSDFQIYGLSIAGTGIGTATGATLVGSATNNLDGADDVFTLNLSTTTTAGTKIQFEIDGEKFQIAKQGEDVDAGYKALYTDDGLMTTASATDSIISQLKDAGIDATKAGNGQITFKKGNTTETSSGSGAGKGLTLQIGDTADSFNQLTVSIKDMHVKAMGIGNVDISKQDGASKAMKSIKAAINYVSDVRGDLGATQNRLEHTINNLSVMQENIQDAESSIRDVDVAEEMMAYTKNNILVQSAQAMLAQANQLPQGVLQLLQ